MSGMENVICALNSLNNVDKAFFIICAAIIAIIIAVYFLIPVFNKKLYKEQRENLHKREAAFKSNLQSSQAGEKSQETDEQQADEKDSKVSTDS